MNCLGQSDFEHLRNGQTTDAMQQCISSHLSSCASCCQLYDAFQENEAFIPRLQAALADEHIPQDDRDIPTNIVVLPTIPGYDVIREIGRGGQGAVYEAMQRSTKRRVAMKVLHGNGRHTAQQLHHFRREIELAAHLNHPGIVAVYDSGTVDGALYYVMAYVDGHPLQRHIDQTAPSLETVLELFCQACEAVAFAHEQGIIHRDIKPSNILVDSRGRVQLVDFGLARRLQAEDAQTHTCGFAGTVAFASPEQVDGKHTLGAATDVYSLGVLLYNLVTRTFPYDVHGPQAEVFDQIRYAEPRTPKRDHKSVDTDLQVILATTLQKDACQRYASVAALLDDVRCYSRRLPIKARRPSTLYHWRKAVARYRVLSAVASVLVLACVVATSGWRMQSTVIDVANERERQSRSVAQHLGANFKNLISAASISDHGVDGIQAIQTQIEQDLLEHPQIKADLLSAIGDAFYTSSEYQLAVNAYRKGHALHGDDHLKLNDLFHLGKSLQHIDGHDQAQQVLEEAQQLAMALYGADHQIVLQVSYSLDQSRGLNAQQLSDKYADQLNFFDPDNRLAPRHGRFVDQRLYPTRVFVGNENQLQADYLNTKTCRK